MRPMDAEELKWRRRSDARTLAEAEQIKADEERYKGAILGAKEIAKEEIERVKGIAKVANMQTPKAPKAPENTVTGVAPKQITTSATNRFDRSNYRNPATIGRF